MEPDEQEGGNVGCSPWMRTESCAGSLTDEPNEQVLSPQLHPYFENEQPILEFRAALEGRSCARFRPLFAAVERSSRVAYFTCIERGLLLRASVLGIRMRRMPSLPSAEILPASTFSGSEKLREKVP
jgi:hypothetical protein